MDTYTLIGGIAIYVLGGLTCVPLICVILYLRCPPAQSPSKRSDQAAEGQGISTDSPDEKIAEILSRSREDDVSAGYFAVCREYVPGGIGGKPPERMTVVGPTVAAGNSNVYQNLYRSVFNRKASDPSSHAGGERKRAANVFFIVLRHGHLILFDNAEELEVRHVISLALYTTSICGDQGSVPEGELWIKRNCIQLTKKSAKQDHDTDSSSTYLFSDNCSEKEDFYHALLESQRRLSDSFQDLPEPRLFGTDHMIKLIRQLHASEDDVQTRWLNALIGRIFLALYKTSRVERLVSDKIRKKISRVSKPTFISSLSLKQVDLGTSAPVFVKPRLKEMAVDGSLTLEADVKYNGNFKAVVAAVVRIDLGQRFRPREVDLVLAGVLKRLDGHVLIHLKPPPSNRIWITFDSMPRLELSLEPLVSSRQITYGVILRAIESRIREVISDTLVLPNWDDIPFFDTEDSEYRGGIWDQREEHADKIDDALSLSNADETDYVPNRNVDAPPSVQSSSTLNLTNAAAGQDLRSEESNISQHQLSPLISPTSIRSNSLSSPTSPSPAVTTRFPATSNKPRMRRSDHENAFNAVRGLSSHVAGFTEPSDDLAAHDDPTDPSASNGKPNPDVEKLDATSSLQDASSASPPAIENPCNSPDTQAIRVSICQSGTSSNEVRHSHADLRDGQGAKPHVRSSSAARATNFNQSLASATAAARRWGTGLLQRQSEISQLPLEAGKERAPIGRGTPLPPPGQPLPGPRQPSWSFPALNSLKRKPLPRDPALATDPGTEPGTSVFQEDPSLLHRTHSLEQT